MTMRIETCDMHTAGEPLRIVISGYPDLKGSTVIEKMVYAETNHDEYRKFVINEPRGHSDMYGAVLLKMEENKNEIGVIFLNNGGYSTMCGHAVIALGRYAIDNGLVETKSPETQLTINCPCGPVKAFVEYVNGKSGQVKFHSVPAFVYKLDVEVSTKSLGVVKVDIAYGGAFYAFINVENISMNLKTTALPKLIDAAHAITEAVKEQVSLHHPYSKELEFIYGTILTDGKDSYADGPTTNICVYAEKAVDRSPTGSGVTARVALQVKKGLLNFGQVKEFKSIIGTSFTGKPVKEIKYGPYDAVIVEVSGIAHYTGNHVFVLEEDDSLNVGFLLSR